MNGNGLETAQYQNIFQTVLPYKLSSGAKIAVRNHIRNLLVNCCFVTLLVNNNDMVLIIERKTQIPSSNTSPSFDTQCRLLSASPYLYLWHYIYHPTHPEATPPHPESTQPRCKMLAINFEEEKQNGTISFNKIHLNMSNISSAQFRPSSLGSTVLIRPAGRSWHAVTYFMSEICGWTTTGPVFVCMSHHELSAKLSGSYFIKLYHLYAFYILEDCSQIQWGPIITWLIFYIQEIHNKHTLLHL